MTGSVRVRVREDADHAVVTPYGGLFFDTLEPLHDALLLLAAGERPRLVLDMSEVSMCDSSGLNLMVRIHRLATRGGGWLRIAAPQPGVRRSLEVTNLIQLLPVYDSVSAARG
jgi:anti-sigma B factor antagonist